MKKGRLIAIFLVTCLTAIGLTIVFTSGYFTDVKKNQTITLKSANLNNKIKAEIDNRLFDDSTSVATISFTSTNNSNVEVANIIKISSSFGMENDGDIYTDDIQALYFYPGDMSDTEIYNDVHNNNSRRSYGRSLEYASEDAGGKSLVCLPELMVAKGTSSEFSVKVILNDDYLCGYGNVLLLDISAVAHTKNEAAGYGFSDDMGCETIIAYDNINEHQDDRYYNYIINGEQYVVTAFNTAYGVTTTYDNPIINLYDEVNIREKNSTYIYDSDNDMDYYGLTLKDGRIYGTPTRIEKYTSGVPYITSLRYYDDKEWVKADTDTGHIYVEVNIAGADMETGVTIGNISSQTYTGSAITPTATLTDKHTGATLVKGTDYTVAYSNNINVGTATVTYTGIGDYSGSITKSFTISPRAISNTTISTPANQTYTGNAFTPTLTITYNGKTLVNSTDYSLSYTNNTNVGTATITISGKGNYTGTTTKTFTISARAISSATVGTVSSYTYTGSAITPTPTITYNGKTLVNGTDYTLSYSNNINAEDDSSITITGKGNFSGTTTKAFVINKCNLSNVAVSSIPDHTYLGYELKPEPTVTYNGKTLKAWQDYELIYKNNTNVGTGTVVIDGTYSANYTGQKEVTFTINPFDIANDNDDDYYITANITNKTYTGSTLSPEEDVVFSYMLDGYDFKDFTLLNGTHYTISCSDYINAGTKTVTITGKGNFKGSIIRSWTIAKASQSAPTSLTYTANSLSKVTLTASGSGKTSLQYSKDGTNWQSSNVFTGLSSETVYTFYARYASSTNYNASSYKTVQGICSNYTWNAPSTGTIGTTVTGLSSLGSSLTTINIPSRATAINASAFSGKTQLTKISSLGTNVTSIGEKAFYNCKNITGSLTIPSKVKSIGNYAFYYCSGLTGSLTIPNTVTSLGTYAFRYCKGFTGSLTIGTGLTSISNYAFANCTGFTGSLTIPNNVTSIGTYAFYNDNGFDGDLTLSNKLTSIGTYAFYNCTDVTGNLNIADTVTSIGTYAFSNCESITGVTRGKGITTIPTCCFRYCSSLVDINIGPNVTTINSAAFGTCLAVKYINLPSKVTTINDSAFEACTNLKYLGIPASITTISSNIISSSNATVYIDKSEGTISSLDADWDYFFNGTVIYRNYYTWSGTSITGLASGHTSLTSIYIPSTCTGISSSAFKSKSSIKSVYFADGCTSLGTYAFQSCSKLADIRLPKTLTTISNYAFRYCSALTSIEIPSSVTSIGSRYVFGSCTKLKYIYIDKNRNSLSGSPWSASTSTTTFVYRNDYSWSSDNTTITGLSYTSLTKLYIPASVGASAFYDNDNITDLKLSENVKIIGEQAFWGCGSISNDLIIPYSVSHIGRLGFMGLKISSLTIEDGALKKIDDLAFYACEGQTITFSNTLTSVDKNEWGSFAVWNKLTTINWGTASRLEHIGDQCFYGCNQLTSITLPSSVKYLDKSCFGDCPKLTTVSIPNSILYIHKTAFNQDTAITTINIAKASGSIANSPWGATNATVNWTGTNSDHVDVLSYDGIDIDNRINEINNPTFTPAPVLTPIETHVPEIKPEQTETPAIRPMPETTESPDENVNNNESDKGNIPLEIPDELLNNTEIWDTRISVPDMNLE